MTIRWITEDLGTAPYFDAVAVPGITLIDVRELVDKEGNSPTDVLRNIDQAVAALRRGEKTVICCDYGMSRSNAIAAGALARLHGLPFDAAVGQVQEKTGEHQIKLEPLMAVRDALGLSPSGDGGTVKRPSLLITGGNGFLGRALGVALGDRFRIVAPSSAELDLTRGNTALDLLAAAENARWIVHLANPRVYTSNVAMGQTLTMLRNVLEVCRNRDIALLYPSSWEVYSGYAGTLLADEATPLWPKGPYGETKLLAENLIEQHRRASGLRCALLRSSPVYGVGSDRPRFLYNFMHQAGASGKIVTHRYRNGAPALDLLHVDDLIAAFARVFDLGYTGTLNLGTGALTTTFEAARMIRDQMGSASDIEQIAIRSHVASIAMNGEKAYRELGWRPAINFETGLAALLAAHNRKRECDENRG